MHRFLILKTLQHITQDNNLVYLTVVYKTYTSNLDVCVARDLVSKTSDILIKLVPWYFKEVGIVDRQNWTTAILSFSLSLYRIFQLSKRKHFD